MKNGGSNDELEVAQVPCTAEPCMNSRVKAIYRLGDVWVVFGPEEDDSGQALGGWEEDQLVAGNRERNSSINTLLGLLRV